MNNNTLILMAAAIAGLQACSSAPDQTATDNTTMATETAKMATVQAAPAPTTMSADTAFANTAAIGGMTEVALGKMAADKGKDPKVKDFGKMMVTDHGKANDELKSIASSKNMQLPMDMDAKHKALTDSLSKFSGKAFDVAYVNTMLDAHKKDLALFQSEAANGTDAELKAFAANTATVIQKHLTMIQQIHDGMK